jgi:hypothetical protein
MIADRNIDIAVGHFDGINILGTDYLNYYGVEMVINYGGENAFDFKINKDD